MTPKEKAEELISKMASDIDFVKINLQSKRCALIAVELALEFVGGKSLDEAFDKTLYLIEVKTEIEKL